LLVHHTIYKGHSEVEPWVEFFAAVATEGFYESFVALINDADRFGSNATAESEDD